MKAVVLNYRSNQSFTSARLLRLGQIVLLGVVVEEGVDTFHTRSRPRNVNWQIFVVAEQQMVCIAPVEQNAYGIRVVVEREPVQGRHLCLLARFIRLCTGLEQRLDYTMSVLDSLVFLANDMVAAKRNAQEWSEAVLVAEVEQLVEVFFRADFSLDKVLSRLDDELADFKVSIFGSKMQGSVPFAVREAQKIRTIDFIFNLGERVAEHLEVAVRSCVEEHDALLLETLTCRIE